MYPAAANCAAEISIKRSRHQLGIRAQKRLLCLLEACEDPFAPINKISINIDKEMCISFWGEECRIRTVFEPALKSKHFFQVQRVELYRIRPSPERCLIQPGIKSQAVQNIIIQADDLYKCSLGAQTGKDSANGMTSACLHCMSKCPRSSPTVNYGFWVHLNECVADKEGNKPPTLANVFCLSIQKEN